MMKKITKFLLLSLITMLLFGNNTMAQEEECGTELTQEQVDYMNDTRDERDIVDMDVFDGGVTTIPIVAHIIRDSNGKGGLDETSLKTSIEQLNEVFAQMNFNFSLCSTNYVDENKYFDYVGRSYTEGSEEFLMAKANSVRGAINIFYLPNTNGNWSSFPVYEQLYGKDWIVMENSSATNGSTLAHEIGHYFNLYHTHQGKSTNLKVYNDELPAKQRIEGVHCGNNIGDELCDTPAEPVRNSTGNRGISGCVDSSCNYFCSDKYGEISYTPNPSNLMSYSQKHCRNFLSPRQIERVLESYVADRFYLSNDCTNDTPNTICYKTDREALIALYNSTNGPNWRNGWDLSADHRGWFGIGVNSEGCVNNIFFRYDNNMSGSIPAEIGDLRYLERVTFQEQNISGSLPPEIGNLSKLTHLKLKHTDLEGEIPKEIGLLTNLEILSLSGNNLKGSIPSEIGNLNKLKFLVLDDNELVGNIPIEINGLKNLELLNLERNDITGTIPPQIGTLTKLTNLLLNDNHLNGVIPNEISNLKELTMLHLGGNTKGPNISLVGDFPNVSNLENLTSLSLYGNELSGCYKPEFKKLCTQVKYPNSSSRDYISSGNHFDATWEDFCNSGAGTCNCKKTDRDALIALYNATNGSQWKRKWDLNADHKNWYGVKFDSKGCVDALTLMDNNLSGHIPNDIAKLHDLTHLYLNNNDISGTFNPNLVYLNNLKYMDLSRNNLSESLPLDIGNFAKLKTLSVGSNNFTGIIPPSIGKIESLEKLHLYNNEISYFIPEEIGNLSKLNTLIMQDTRIRGEIPASLGNLANLTYLNLTNNNLSGCYKPALKKLCTQLSFPTISHGNNFDEAWKDFCANGAGACVSNNFVSGDLNNDGTVNHADAIYLGLSYGSTGNTCATENRNECPNWASEVNGVNAKFQDGDGNGRIDEGDLKAIEENYGITSSVGNSAKVVSKDFRFIITEVAKNANELVFDLSVESSSGGSISTHGLACSINFGDLSIKEVKVDYKNSALKPTIKMNIFNAATNTLDIAMSRTDKINKNCNTPVASVSITTIEELDTDEEYELNIAKVNSLSATGILSEGDDSNFDSNDINAKLTVDNSTTNYLNQNSPNPFSEQTTVSYFIPELSQNAHLKIYNLTGNLLQTKAIDRTGTGNLNINSKNLQPGLYIYTLEINGVAKASKKMIIH